MLLIFFPLVVLAILELGLRVIGYGYSTRYFLQREDGKSLTTNPKFAWQFHPREIATRPHPLILPLHKTPGTRRIFVLGESAAQGTPAPAFGFARALEVLLQESCPEQRFEVVNAAMRGINSHVVLPIARECALYEPDLFLAYMGNNEAIGLYAPDPDRLSLASHWRWLRAEQWLKATKLAQAIDDVVRAVGKGAGRRPEQDMAFFRGKRLAADDRKREPIYGNFRRNLQDICRAARVAGTPILISTVAVNLRDFPPLGSLHRRDLAPAALGAWEKAYAQGTNAEARGLHAEAIGAYEAAARVDDHFAELHFRLARCCLAAGQLSQARQHFILGRDWDALPFRTDSRLNEVIRELAAAKDNSRMVLVDAEQALAERADSPVRLPGEDMFNDHVHFCFDGDFRLAQLLLPQVLLALKLEVSKGTKELSRHACGEMLGFSLWDELSVASAMVRSLNKPPYLDQVDHAERQARAEAGIRQRMQEFHQQGGFKRCNETYRIALARRSQDWQINFNYGTLLSDFGDAVGAEKAFEAVIHSIPEFLPVRILMGQILWDAGRRDEAVRQFREALRYDPDFGPAKDALAQAEKKGFHGGAFAAPKP